MHLADERIFVLFTVLYDTHTVNPEILELELWGHKNGIMDRLRQVFYRSWDYPDVTLYCFEGLVASLTVAQNSIRYRLRNIHADEVHLVLSTCYTKESWWDEDILDSPALLML